MRIPLDFSETLGAVPAGTYAARIVGCDQKVGKASGKPYLNWKVEIFGAKDQRVNGRVLFTMTMIVGNLNPLKKLYKAAMGQELAGELETADLMGKQISITVAEAFDDQGNQREFSEVKNVAPFNERLVDSPLADIAY